MPRSNYTRLDKLMLKMSSDRVQASSQNFEHCLHLCHMLAHMLAIFKCRPDAFSYERLLSSGRSEIYLAAVHSFLWSIPYSYVSLSAGGYDGILIKAHPAHGVVLIHDLGLNSSVSGRTAKLGRPEIPSPEVAQQSLFSTQLDALLDVPPLQYWMLGLS